MTSQDNIDKTVADTRGGGPPISEGGGPRAPVSAPLPQIEGYTITGILGEGGMGAVYDAWQHTPRRRVALKLVRPGLMSASLLKRFNLEVEVLGRLEHPVIARIYAAGTAEAGGMAQPYFAMEFIEGKPLTRYAQEHALSTRQRVELLLKVANGVHHAHQKGVIHRDLKPANILVNAQGEPKILDFGVARVTDSDVHLTTMPTDIGMLVGTLQYMSPEQATGQSDELDTRTDVYALGVVAYEVLTGERPYKLDQKLIHEAARIILESEAARLSSLNRALRGDLETIVGKSMEKDKERRYASASALAEDLERYLNDEPIAARPPSVTYQLGKFAKRNRLLVGSAAAIILAVLLGGVASAIGFVRARAAERVAVAERENAERQQVLAEKRLYHSLVAEGSAQAAMGRWRQARTKYGEARQLAGELNTSDLLARAGQWEAQVKAPEPAYAMTASHGVFLAAAVADNGAEFVSAQADGSIARRDLATSKANSSFNLPRTPGTVVLSKNGDFALIGYPDGVVESRDTKKGTVHKSFTKTAESPSAVAVSMDGNLALLGFADGRIEVWDGAAASPVHALRVHAAKILSLSISADGTRALSGSGDRTAIVWDLIAGKETWIFRGHRDWVFATDLSSDGKLAVTGCGDFVQAHRNPLLMVWEVETGAIRQAFHDLKSGISHVRFSKDDRRILSGTFLAQSKIWDIESGQELFALDEPGHQVRDSAFAPDGGRVITLAGDRLSHWTLRPVVPYFKKPGPDIFISDLSLSPDERLCAVGDRSGVLRLFDVASGCPVRSFETGELNPQYVSFLADGRRLAAGQNRIARIWDIASGRETARVDTGGPGLQVVRAAPDGRHVILAGDQGLLVLWDPESETFVRSFEGFGRAIRALATSGDGRLLFAGGEGGELGLWEFSSGRLLHRFPTPAGDGSGILSLAVHGAFLLAGSETGEVRLYDTSERRHVRTFRSDASGLEDLRFVPDSSYALSADLYGRVTVWDWNAGEAVRELKGRSERMVTLDILKNGNWLVSRTGGVWLHDFAEVDARRGMAPEVAAALPRMRSGTPRADDFCLLARWYRTSGDLDEAVRFYEKAREAGVPIDPLELGQVYWRLGRKALAAKEYERALAEARDSGDEIGAGYLSLCFAALSDGSDRSE